MLETDLRHFFELQAAAEQPTRLNIEATYRAARTRLRIRRLATIATPLIAIVAVTAIALTFGAQAGHRGPLGPGPRHQRTHHARQPSAPVSFNPLHPYLSFGWLPPGTSVVSGESGTTAQYVNAGRPGVQVAWMLSAYAAGHCSVANLHFRCAGLDPRFDVLVSSRLPDIGGRPAYWTGPSQYGGILIWQYARDGWAMLDFHSSADAVRVAEHVIFGGPTAPLKFPVQLTGMPGWQLKYAMFNPGRGGSLATDAGFATGAALHAPGQGSPSGYPEVSITSSGQPCSFTPGESARSVVAGYRVTTTTGPFKLGGTFHEVCAASADGLWVDVTLSGRHAAVDVATIFAHLKLLGPDPANWTTNPIG